MTTETAPAEQTEQQFGTSAADAFDAAMKGVNSAPPADNPPADEPPAKQEAPAQTQPEGEFPDEILTGKKSEPKPPADPAKDDEAFAEQLPKGISKAARENITKINRELREAKAERETLKAELEAAKQVQATNSGEAAAAELKAARERLAEMEANIERIAFEKSPRFQKFVERETATITAAKAYLDGTEIDASIVDRAAHASGAKRLELLRSAGAEPDTIAAIMPYLASLDSIAAEKSGALADHKQTAEQWAATERQQAEQRRSFERAEEDRVFAKVNADVAKVFEPFQKVEGHEKWNAQVDQLNAEAKQFYNGDMPLERVAEIAQYGVGAKVIHSMFHQQRATIATLREQVAKLTAAQPSGGGDGGPAKPSDTGDFKADAAAAFERAMGR